MTKIVADLLSGVNIQSFYELDTALKIILRYPDSTSALAQKMRTDWDFLSKHFSPLEELKNYAVYMASGNVYEKQFRMGTHGVYSTDVFQFHHGLSDCNKSVLDYIAGKTFVDGGAFIGDSAMML